jgi:TonB family protein
MLAKENMRFDHLAPGRQDLQISLFNPHLPSSTPPPRSLSNWNFRLPDEIDVPEPQIEITPDIGAGSGTRPNEATERLAPELDPSHVNEEPELPSTLGALIAALSLRLNILVLPDGSIFDIHVLQSTGEAGYDKLAVQWVKTNWRFLPAIRNGQPIEAWTTVMIRFAPIH